MQKHKVSKHFQGSIRNIFINERVFKRAIAKLKEQTSVDCHLCINLTDTRNAAFHTLDDLIEDFRMIILQILGNKLQIIAIDRKVLGISNDILHPPCGIDMKI